MSPSTNVPDADIFDASGRGLQHHGLRRANERAVLSVIGFNPTGVSNADIARLSGLAPQTVSAILTDLETSGMVARGEVLRGRRGQPATPIHLRADGAYAIGVEIGWRHLDVALLDMHANVLHHIHRGHHYPDARTLVGDLTAMIEMATAQLPQGNRARLRDLGIAMPTNMARYMAISGAPAEQQLLWSALDLAADLRQSTGLDVALHNDGNAACWAELIAYPRPRPAGFIYFLISRYIAAGIVNEGMLWEGPTRNSANLGAMLVSAKGQLRSAHSIGSIAALTDRLRTAGHDVDESAVDQWPWDSYSETADAWLADSAAALAQVIFNTRTVTETSTIIIDGVVPATLVQRLVEKVRVEVAALPETANGLPQIMAGHLGALAPAIGAAELMLYRRFLSRSLVDLAG